MACVTYRLGDLRYNTDIGYFFSIAHGNVIRRFQSYRPPHVCCRYKNQVIDEQKNILLLYREIPGPVRHNVASIGASISCHGCGCGFRYGNRAPIRLRTPSQQSSNAMLPAAGHRAGAKEWQGPTSSTQKKNSVHEGRMRDLPPPCVIIRWRP